MKSSVPHQALDKLEAGTVDTGLVDRRNPCDGDGTPARGSHPEFLHYIVHLVEPWAAIPFMEFLPPGEEPAVVVILEDR